MSPLLCSVVGAFKKRIMKNLYKATSVKSLTYHYHAVCKSCDWTEGASSNCDIPRTRREAIKHVEEHGHVVTIEKGNSITYHPVKKS